MMREDIAYLAEEQRQLGGGMNLGMLPPFIPTPAPPKVKKVTCPKCGTILEVTCRKLEPTYTTLEEGIVKVREAPLIPIEATIAKCPICNAEVYKKEGWICKITRIIKTKPQVPSIPTPTPIEKWPVVQAEGYKEIFMYDHNERLRWFPNPETFSVYGYSYDDIQTKPLDWFYTKPLVESIKDTKTGQCYAPEKTPNYDIYRGKAPAPTPITPPVAAKVGIPWKPIAVIGGGAAAAVGIVILMKRRK